MFTGGSGTLLMRTYITHVICTMTNKMSWKARPKKVIVLYVKVIVFIIVEIPKYYETREISYESTATMR